ncbi:MAG: helix-turn-helix domain-containing protein [Paludibacteraceae bacterium]|nr:helix-turn-helix domain-containing protein [Paludibacteraceae bacterium]MBR1481171.1 helix-turn-helix domain-containing protein [Paludibacteraceae bacterium]
MDIYFSSNNALLVQIGQKVKYRRITANLTQKQLSEQAGVALSAVGNIEKGQNSSLLTFLQVLRTLRSLDLLEPLFREEEISPIAYAEALRKSTTPQRVRNHNYHQPSKPESTW